MQLGKNFSLPTINREIITTEFIKYVEHNIDKLPRNICVTISNRVAPILNNLAHYSFKSSPVDRELTTASLVTRKFIKDNPDVIFTRADKGNVTVAVNKVDYLKNMDALLNDNATYTIVNKDPTKKLIRNLHELLVRWKKRVHHECDVQKIKLY